MLPKFGHGQLATLLERKKCEVRCIRSRGTKLDLSILTRNLNFPWDMWSVVDLEVIYRFKMILSGGATKGSGCVRNVD